MKAKASYLAWIRANARGFNLRVLVAAGISMLVASWAQWATAADAAAGNAYVYRLVNGYNKEVVGEVSYEVAKVEGDRVTLTVMPDVSSTADSRTDIVTRDGNGLRQPLYSHGELVEYEFTTAYPAYAFPLDDGKRWSVRVQARVPGSKKSRSVRVDGHVLGRERVRVPAGEFDAIKIHRSVYAGDAGDFREETRIDEIEWYAPSLGRAVRAETRSEYMDTSQCTRGMGCDIRGPWDIYELVKASPAAQRP